MSFSFLPDTTMCPSIDGTVSKEKKNVSFSNLVTVYPSKYVLAQSYMKIFPSRDMESGSIKLYQK